MSETKMTVDQLKTLRLRFPGVGMYFAKRAFEKAGGDMDRAAAILVEEGNERAEDLAKRPSPQGYVHAYTHGDGRIGVLVELRCETDFVSRTPAFREVAKGIAMHLAATIPDDLKASIEQPLLRDQPYILDESKTVGEVLAALSVSVGENVHVSQSYVIRVG